MINLPILTEIEDILFQAATGRFGPLVRSTKQLASAIKDLSDYYITDPGLRRKCPDSPAHQAARMLFFNLADMPKAFLPAAEYDRLSGVTSKSTLRILDIGAGYGAQSLGLMAYLFSKDSSRHIQLDVIDRDSKALEALGELLTHFRKSNVINRVDYAISRRNLERKYTPAGDYDFIIVGNTLCELDAESHYPLIVKLLSSLTPSGVVFLIEPALKNTTRNLHALRDRLLDDDQCKVIAPCTRNDTCPCLLTPDDWCHESRTYLLPPICRQLSTATGLRRVKLKWSYLTLTRQEPHSEMDRIDAWRVISGVRKQKGGHEVLLCGTPGWCRVVLPGKARTPGNEIIKKLDRGCLVRIQDAEIVNDRIILDRSSSVIAEDPSRVTP